MKLESLCRPIELVLSDVDGVLTDGGIWYDNQGFESKRFHIQDGLGIRLWQSSGFAFGIVTGRTSQIVKLRSSELGIKIVRQGVQDKRSTVRDVAESLSLGPEQTCYIGDDLPDIPAMKWAGLGVAVSDAAPEAREAADHVTSAPGGQGAVREVLEMLLKSNQRWEDLIRRYTQ